MENLIDELHNDHIKFSKVLDLLAEQLELIHKGESADYYLMQDAVSFIENYPDFAFVPKENAIFNKSTETYKFIGLNSAIIKLRSENHELKALAQSLLEYINAALEDIIFEKEPFEQQLETCIQRQRDHMETEENTILPLLRNMLSENQLQKLSTELKSHTSTFNLDDTSIKYGELYNRITDTYDSNFRNTH